MDVRWMTGFLDSPTADVEPFWAAITGTSLSPRRDGGIFATLVPARGDAYLRTQVTARPARTHLDPHAAGAPEAAGGSGMIASGDTGTHPDLHVDEVASGDAGTHLHLHVDEMAEAAREAVALGARVVRDAGTLVVLRSPAGLEFCLVAWRGERACPPAVRWPGGQSSRLDQVCLDVPESRFEAEASFWSALTGWERRPSDLPQFEWLAPPDGMPVRLLFQRIGSPVAGMHPDFACDDVPAEVARHVALGAEVVRVVPGDWTTLRDPAGREYCVTARSPF